MLGNPYWMSIFFEWDFAGNYCFFFTNCYIRGFFSLILFTEFRNNKWDNVCIT
jgi:hypothetical protein